MTEPQPVMAQAEQDQLTRQVGRALLAVAGDGWQRVRAEYRSAGRHVEADVFITGPDGAEHPVRPPQEVVEGLSRLRQGMYRPGRGTWLSALYVLEPPSAFSAEFEPDVEPQWRRVPPPIGFQDELRFFPRGDEHIPGWLRQRAGLPPLPEPSDQPTPPPGLPAQNPPPPGNPFGGNQPDPSAGRAPTPPSGIPANPPPGNQPGPATPPPGVPATPFGGNQPGRPPTPPSGTPANQQGTPPFGGDPAANRPPTPPSGMPANQQGATPFGGNQPDPSASRPPTPPSGTPTHQQGTPFGGDPSANRPPTPPPGMPANQGAPTPPPGVPATPFGGNNQPTPGAPAPFGNQPEQGRPTGLAGAFGPHPQATPGAPADQNDWFNR